MALAAPSHSANVMAPDVDDGEGRAVAELLGHTGQMIVHQHGFGVPQELVRAKVDAGVRFVAAWPMRPRGSIPGPLTAH